MKKAWLDALNASITVCDLEGNIVYMNEKSAKSFLKYGGSDLLGKNLFDCHSDSSRKILKNLLEKELENTYSTEKGGKKSIICQRPVYENKKMTGLIEIAIDLPPEMPHFKRD